MNAILSGDELGEDEVGRPGGGDLAEALDHELRRAADAEAPPQELVEVVFLYQRAVVRSLLGVLAGVVLPHQAEDTLPQIVGDELAVEPVAERLVAAGERPSQTTPRSLLRRGEVGLHHPPHLDLVRVASHRLGAGSYPRDAVLNYLRGYPVADDHAVGDAAREVEQAGPLGGEPERHGLGVPLHAHRAPVPFGLAAGAEGLERLAIGGELSDGGGARPDITEGTVAGTHAEEGAAAGDLLHAGHPPGGHSGVTGHRVRHHGTDAGAGRVLRGEGERHVEVAPQVL